MLGQLILAMQPLSINEKIWINCQYIFGRSTWSVRLAQYLDMGEYNTGATDRQCKCWFLT